ncbi:hypothetical protein [Malacoplasma iowae]|uniref:hypothetical protein n=1 Tax=Malacoplasma iowae TaxID=2116 RepID=UPI002A18A2E3|nr:hypothetical protein [Malacoplasma iowae]WPL39440.1 hypothetical protein QX183_02730 [Malacoplasma iowae]
MKIKLLKTIGIIGCLGIVGATPVMLTSCKKKSTSQSATVTPQLKKSISGIGSLDEFITTSSKANDVNTNVKFVLNSNKESVIANWVCIPESERNNINLDTSLVGWDNDNWGSMSFDDWNKTSQSTKVEWKGSKDSANSNEKLEFKSNKELRDFLNSNIEKISKNAITNLGDKKASLADADIKVDENGNLLVAIKTEEATKTNIDRSKRDVKTTTTNYTLSIPSNVINFNPTINLKASFGNNQSTSAEVVFTYTVTSTPLIEQTFATNANNKKAITLAEMATSDSDSIGLWKTVTDEGILKALGWLDSNKSLEEGHVDGDGIDSTLLKEDTIISDLGINGLTKEKLLGIQIEMKQRDVSKIDYNGEYNIIVSTTLNNGQNTDLNLNFNTYKIVSQKSESEMQHPLQVNVPNAYYIDSYIGQQNDGSQYRTVLDLTIGSENNLLSTPFKIAGKNVENGSNNNNNKYIEDNFKNQTILNAFIKHVNNQINQSKHFNLLNGFDLKLSETNGIVHRGETNQTGNFISGYEKVITLELTLRKGFTYVKKSLDNFAISQSNKTIKLSNSSISNKKISFGFSFSSQTDNTKTLNLDNLISISEYETQLKM